MLFGLFKKTIEVKEKDFLGYPCFKVNKRKTKKIRINTKFKMSNECECVFACKGRVGDVFVNPGEYELNGNSLPKLFKIGKFNKPNRKNRISPYFSCQIYCVPKQRNEIECLIKKYSFKDLDYGRQKTTFRFAIEFSVIDSRLFVQGLISSFNITNKNVEKSLSKWFIKDFKKWASKKRFTLNDIIGYTKGYEEELLKLLTPKYLKLGMQLSRIRILDVIVNEEILQEIRNNDRVTSSIEKRLSKQDFTVSVDGVKIEKKLKMNEHYKVGSLREKYVNQSNGIEVKKDNSEYVITTLAGNRDEFGNEIKENKKVTGKHCLYCGKLIPSDATYCPYCSNICD